MPAYEYEGVNTTGKTLKGLIDADSDRAARTKLKTQGILPTKIALATGKQSLSPKKDFRSAFNSERVSLRELAVATNQLAMLIRTGKPLVGALAVLSDQVESEVLKRTIVQIKDRVEEGDTLARALAAHPKVFSKLYVNMVSSAEASGTLDTVLQKLGDYLDAQVELNRRVKSALMYPCIMLFLCSAVIVALMTIVVPRIVEMFVRQGAKLPLPTRIVMAASDFFVSYWWAVLAGLVALVIGLKKYHASPAGRAVIDNLLFKIPIFSGVYLKVATARVASTLGALLQSGVGVLEGLAIVRNIVENVHLQKILDDAQEGVREGKPLSRELMRGGKFPTLLGHMIASGEESGEMDRMMLQAGKEYEKDVSATLSSLTTILEPIMLVLVGGIVLVIVISVLLPMAELITAIQKR